MSRGKAKTQSDGPDGVNPSADGAGEPATAMEPEGPEEAATGKDSRALGDPQRPLPWSPPSGPVTSAFQLWLAAYRIELLLFVGCFIVFSAFSSQRFLRQSAAPHFVYQSQAWLEGRLDIDPAVLPNLEDWACVREIGGEKTRCAGRPLPTDRWYVSFPSFPAVVMLPFVALHGYQFNDTSFSVFFGALAVALFFSLLRTLARRGETRRTREENTILALTLAFGSVLFYCTIRGEVWFSAEVMGVALTCLYLRNAVGARRPVLAGLFFSMATLTRTPLVFTGLFFVLEALCAGPHHRLAQLKGVLAHPKPALEKLGKFTLGALPLAVLAAAYNVYRFGKPGEFGHSFLFNNRVNAEVDRLGLFNIQYLQRNLEAAFFKLPKIQLDPFQLGYDPHGLSLLLTLPLIVFLVAPKERARLHWPLWLTVAVTALPGLFYMNTGYMQFGFRFSLDYTVYLLLLFAIGGWSLRNKWVLSAVGLGVVVNFWGALAFRGYTEYVRGW